MYTDRFYVTFNGTAMFLPGNILSIDVDANGHTSAVNGMTTSGDMSGYVHGNMEYDIRATVAVQNKTEPGAIDFVAFDYETGNATITLAASSKSYGGHEYNGPTLVFTGVAFKTSRLVSSGAGQAATYTYEFGALHRVAL
jgi:hypothetical protein